MTTQTKITARVAALATALLLMSCTEPTAPDRRTPNPSNAPNAPSFADVGMMAASGSGITFDIAIGTANQVELPCRCLIKGFDNGNPRRGDAMVATFFWVSATPTNIIDEVTDVVNDANFTPVGNTYHLVRFVHSGNVSIATYVATNIQNFPDPNQTPRLAVRANLSETVSDGGLQLSAWSGVASDFTQAMGASNAASGSATAGTAYTADPGAIDIGAGALAYGVSLVSRGGDLVDAAPPAEFTILNVLSDAFLVHEANYLVSSSARSVDPQWLWQFSQPSTWLATVLALNPNQPPVAGFTSSCVALACSFTSTSSDPDGTIAGYSWTFGDGGTSTEQNPLHIYAAAGTYTVTLTVTDDQGATNSTSQSVTVKLPNQPPVVDAGPDQNVLIGALFTENATFSDPDNDGPWSYRIDWGDGSYTTGTAWSQGTISKGHSYITILPRSYTVRVTVKDSHGASGSDTKVVNVVTL